MSGSIAFVALFTLITFLIAVILRRAYLRTALMVGSIPAATLAVDNVPALADPRSWFVLVPVWLLCVGASLIGAWLARLVHARWRRA